MLEKDPELRCKLEDVADHPWIKETIEQEQAKNAQRYTTLSNSRDHVRRLFSSKSGRIFARDDAYSEVRAMLQGRLVKRCF